MGKTVCLVMIVKNESKIIEKCLDHVIKYIDYWVICDTGSSDGTPSIIKKYFEKNGISGELYEDKWVDFAHNRTLAFQKAKFKADYSFVMDADDRLIGELIIPEGDYTDFRIKFKLNTIEFHRKLIFKNDLDWKYVGVVHEYPCLIDSTIPTESGVINNCYIKDGQCGARSNTGSCKFDRDIKLLLKGIKNEPNNDRYYFYLAQSYYDIGDSENAMKYYKKRITMAGWNEEVYYSMYRYAQCKMKLKDKLNITFEEVALDYIKAYNYRPCRLEALYDIVRYCRENEKIQMAYAFAIMAYDTFTNYPQDILFVDGDIHKYKFMDELAISAYYSNNHTLAISINNKLIEMINNNEINLDLQRINQNKKFSVEAFKKNMVEYISNN